MEGQKWTEFLESVKTSGVIEDICGDEGYAMESIQEHFSETERCQRMEEIVDLLEEAAAKVECAVEDLEGCLA